MSYAVKNAMASKEKRFLNLIIDYVVRLILMFAFGLGLGLVLVMFEKEEFLNEIEDNKFVDIVFGVFFLLIYYLIFETLSGRTVGKYITNTKVVKLDGSLPTFNEILSRTFSRIVPFEPFSFLDSSQSGWHDDWSNTVVIDIKKYEEERFKNDGLEQIDVKEEH